MLLLLAVALTGSGLAARGADAHHKPFVRPLPIPKVVTGRRIRIPIRAAGVPILPGSRTQMTTFDGSFPGPTIRVPSGSPVKVEFVNQLKALPANVLSIHNHGGHNPAADDGQPDDFLIAPGASRVYTYPLREGGKPERASFQWYHDHRMDGTAEHIWNGLAGMFILDDRVDQALPLPKGRFDVPLLIADRSFTAQNQLTDPYPFGGPAGMQPPPNDGVQGDHILINGAPQPVFKVEARRYRLRLLNASNFRSYDLSTQSLAMKQIATDSGLMSAPVKRASVRLGPAERAEVIVDFSGKQGRQFDLKASFLDDRMTAGPHDAASPRLMRFNVVKRKSPDRSSVPARLRPAPALSPPPTITRQWRMTSGVTDASHRFSGWAINGKGFNPDRVDARVPLGKTERWRFTNATGRPHAMHVHGADFKVLDGPNKGQLKDTVLLPTPGASATVAIKFTDHAGKFVLHCHMLDHEDNGMMAAFEVVNGPGDKGAAP